MLYYYGNGCAAATAVYVAQSLVREPTHTVNTHSPHYNTCKTISWWNAALEQLSKCGPYDKRSAALHIVKWHFSGPA